MYQQGRVLLSATPSQLLSRPSQISSAGLTAFSQGSQALLRHSCVPARHSPSSVPHALFAVFAYALYTAFGTIAECTSRAGALLSATPSQLLSRPSQISSAGLTAFSQGSQALLRHSCVPLGIHLHRCHARCSPSAYALHTAFGAIAKCTSRAGGVVIGYAIKLLSRPSQISSAGLTAFSQGSQALLRHSCVPAWHSPSSVPQARCSPSWQTRPTQPLAPSQNVPAGQGALLSATPSQLLSRLSQISSAGLTAFSQGSQALLRHSCVPARHSPSRCHMRAVRRLRICAVHSLCTIAECTSRAGGVVIGYAITVIVETIADFIGRIDRVLTARRYCGTAGARLAFTFIGARPAARRLGRHGPRSLWRHRRMYQPGARCYRLRHHSYCRDHRRPHRPD